MPFFAVDTDEYRCTEVCPSPVPISVKAIPLTVVVQNVMRSVGSGSMLQNSKVTPGNVYHLKKNIILCLTVKPPLGIIPVLLHSQPSVLFVFILGNFFIVLLL